MFILSEFRFLFFPILSGKNAKILFWKHLLFTIKVHIFGKNVTEEKKIQRTSNVVKSLFTIPLRIGVANVNVWCALFVYKQWLFYYYFFFSSLVRRSVVAASAVVIVAVAVVVCYYCYYYYDKIKYGVVIAMKCSYVVHTFFFPSVSEQN